MRDFSRDHSALALNTATLGHNVDGHGAGWSPDRIIDACAERGFGAITFWRREFTGNEVEIGERTRASGMDVCGLCRAPFLVGPLAPAPHDAMIDDLKSSIDMAAALQAHCLTICVGGVEENSHSMRSSLANVRSILEQILPYAEQCGVTLAIEPLNPVYGGNRSCLVTVRDAVDMCNAIDHALLKIAIDVYHIWWDLSLGDQLKRLPAGKIAGYHLCDWLPDTQDILLDRGMMGDGVADLKHIRQAVERAGYDGYCEVEIFSAGNWWKKPPEEVLDKCVERFRTVC